MVGGEEGKRHLQASIPAAKHSPAPLSTWMSYSERREMREENIWEPGNMANAELSVYFIPYFRKIDSCTELFDVLLIAK